MQLTKCLYGASEFGFANDPDFYVVSDKPKFWRKVIENYYTKYSGIHAWHNALLTNVADTGKIITPFGREFEFDCFYEGEFKLPATIIKNYPVQGTGADVLAVARPMLRPRLLHLEHKLICTVHDSIVIDTPKENVEEIVTIVNQVFKELPAMINRVFNCGWDLEVKVEILVGQDMYNLFEYK